MVDWETGSTSIYIGSCSVAIASNAGPGPITVLPLDLVCFFLDVVRFFLGLGFEGRAAARVESESDALLPDGMPFSESESLRLSWSESGSKSPRSDATDESSGVTGEVGAEDVSDSITARLRFKSIKIGRLDMEIYRI
jgi:hypothetical protein